ncbi:MAG: hypothetical protein J6J79_09560 [Lachnospiraceae bacterium]|nr:hypothetical protein [Lachnospiraceae bacterium]
MYRLKKIVGAMALAALLTQTIGVTTVYAEEGENQNPIATEECGHFDCGNYKDGLDELDDVCSDCTMSYTYTPNDDSSTHQVEWSCNCGANGSYEGLCSFYNGSCGECGKEQQSTICEHENCSNTVTIFTVCDECSSSTVNFEKIDENTHRRIERCDGCPEIIATGVDAHNIVESCKMCYYCGYKPDESESTDNTSKEAKPEEKQETTETKVSEVIIPKAETKTADGKVIKSSVNSVYTAAAVNGAAVITPSKEIKEAVGIKEEGTKASFYICDNRSKIMKEHMVAKATENNVVVSKIFNSDMYSITQKGVIEKIHSSEKPVSLIYGLPAELKGKKVSILAFNNMTGEVKLFEDVDDDPTTITIEATIFGVYALVNEK